MSEDSGLEVFRQLRQYLYYVLNGGQICLHWEISNDAIHEVYCLHKCKFTITRRLATTPIYLGNICQ